MRKLFFLGKTNSHLSPEANSSIIQSLCDRLAAFINQLKSNRAVCSSYLIKRLRVFPLSELCFLVTLSRFVKHSSSFKRQRTLSSFRRRPALPLYTSRHSPDGARWLCVDRRRSEPTSLSIGSFVPWCFVSRAGQSVSQARHRIMLRSQRRSRPNRGRSLLDATIPGTGAT